MVYNLLSWRVPARLPLPLAAAVLALLLPAAARAQQLGAVPLLSSDAAMVIADAEAPATAPRSGEDNHWSASDARKLLAAVETIGSEGLDPHDYRPQVLARALSGGEGAELDKVASAVFMALARDLRDGRTPLVARRGYLIKDSDSQDLPLAPKLHQALASGDIAGALAGLDPVNPGFAALKQALANTSADDSHRRAEIRINMDRWRWLPRDLGKLYLLVNIPEFRVRLVVNREVLASHRVIVGKPGRTATPQITAMVKGVIFNPTWTPPQSIVVGEGLGRKVLANPRWAAQRGYVASRRADGSLRIVQQPGPLNALGAVKLDMPNPYAIYLHDTPSKSLFDKDVRAFSHGCIRTQGIMQLGLVLTVLGDGPPIPEVEQMIASGKTSRAVLARPIPVTTAYFTMGLDDDGELVSFPDIYQRDPPVLAALGPTD